MRERYDLGVCLPLLVCTEAPSTYVGAHFFAHWRRTMDAAEH